MNYSENNLFSLYNTISKHAQEPILEYDYYNKIMLGSGKWPNVIYNTNFNIDSIEDEIKKLKTDIELQNHPFLLTCNATSNDSMIDRIAVLSHSSSQWTAMTLLLEQYEAQKNKTGLEILLATNSEELNQWCEVLNNELMGNDKIDYELFKKMQHDENIRVIIGKVNNKVVATCLSNYDNKECGLYLIATSSDQRGKGYGRAITEYALNMAKEDGLDTVQIQATKLGEFVYRKIGFQQTGVINVFRLK